MISLEFYIDSLLRSCKQTDSFQVTYRFDRLNRAERNSKQNLWLTERHKSEIQEIRLPPPRSDMCAKNNQFVDDKQVFAKNANFNVISP